MDIKTSFSTDLAKKIFGNLQNAKVFLTCFSEKVGLEVPSRLVTRGPNRGRKEIALGTNEIRTMIVNHRDYNVAKDIIRGMFKQTEKYISGKESHNIMAILIDERNRLKLNEIRWPFSQGDFDGFVQRVNSENSTGLEKDEKVKSAAVKYRRIKEINTVRNDFIETLIFEKNSDILPTLNHNRGVDFFINGVSFDQKVAKSPTAQFQRDFDGKDSKTRIDHAIANPVKVAEYLYKYQDEGRFGADSRLLVVYLEEDVSIDKIAEIIDQTNLYLPLEVNFEYIHNKGKPTENTKTYKVHSFVILLHN